MDRPDVWAISGAGTSDEGGQAGRAARRRDNAAPARLRLTAGAAALVMVDAEPTPIMSLRCCWGSSAAVSRDTTDLLVIARESLKACCYSSVVISMPSPHSASWMRSRVRVSQ